MASSESGIRRHARQYRIGAAGACKPASAATARSTTAAGINRRTLPYSRGVAGALRINAHRYAKIDKLVSIVRCKLRCEARELLVFPGQAGTGRSIARFAIGRGRTKSGVRSVRRALSLGRQSERAREAASPWNRIWKSYRFETTRLSRAGR